MAVVVRAQARGVIAHGGAGRLSAIFAPFPADRRGRMRPSRALTANQCVAPAALRPPGLATLRTRSVRVLSRRCPMGGQARGRRSSSVTKGRAWTR